MFALLDIWHAIKHIIVTADPLTIGIALVVILIAGLILGRIGNILNGTVLALLGFVLVKYVIAVFQGMGAVAYAKADWNAFIDIEVLGLIAYILIFGVLIAIVHLIRSAVSR